MKKISYLFIAIISFLGVSYVKADTNSYSYAYDNFSTAVSLFNNYSNEIQLMKDYWQNNYNSSCPYYVIEWNYVSSVSDYNIRLICLNSTNYSVKYNIDSPVRNDDYFVSDNNQYIITYDINSNSFSYNNTTGQSSFWLSSPNNQGKGLRILDSNFIPIFNSNDIVDSILIPSYSDNDYDFPSYEIRNGDNLPTISSLISGEYEVNMFTHYTEINLNNYSYVALSLKDYSLRNDNTNQFSTNIYTKGQLCLTPVYDYGMKEKVDIYSGYQIDRCSVIYNDFTPVRTYILKQDLENNAIYYLKAYDTSIENKVKVDNTVFNISYISLENADNPSVSVNGKNYPTIAYDDLSSSSTKSEDEGYVSGQAVNIIDQFNEDFINDFFSNPLKMLKSVWGAIVSMLSLVTIFIALLPPVLQGFLLMSLALAIILGIIKILL